MNFDRDPADWRLLKDVFNGAIALPVADRSTYLDIECEGNADLRRAVERLLASHDETGPFLESPAAMTYQPDPTAQLVGRTIGPYQLLSLLGSGGMGDVYKARDTRLGRTVAIKLIAGHVARDPQFRERFEHEARAIATVSHPGICTIHDVGRDNDLDFIVMEYLEGETLAARLGRARLPIDQALRFATEIVSALDRAHSAGMVHRDLKPANIMLTKAGAKLLDFGLATMVRSDGAGGDRLTNTGVVMGTVQYMAPEQLEGKALDARTDLFAFGAVLYEMLTGKRAFEGSSQTSLIAAILEHDPPPVSTLQPLAPKAVDRLVQTCLAKDRDERWQTARDLLRELRWVADPAASVASTTSVVPVKRHTRGAAMAAAGVCAALAIAAVIWWFSSQPTGESSTGFPIRFTVTTPETSEPLSIALSPDGRQLAFVGTSDGVQKISLRTLDQVSSTVLRGTDGASYPFWSPDGRSLGFFADGKLKRIDVAGGQPTVLADAPIARGGTWNATGSIIFAPNTASELRLVPVSGGNIAAVTTLATGQNSHRWPQFLPDGRRFLFQSVQSEARGLFIGSLDGDEPVRVLTDENPIVFVPPNSLLEARRGALFALAFDPARGTVTGDPVPIAPTVGVDASYVRGAFTASANGVLAYRPGAAEGRELMWVDRSGKILGSVGAPDDEGLGNPELAPDGKRIAVLRTREGNTDVWLIDTDTGVQSRFTFNDATDFLSVWSRDGRILVFSSNRNHTYDLFEKPSNGSGEDHVLLQSTPPKIPTSFSSDGGLLIYQVQVPKTGIDIWALPLHDRDPKPFPVVQTVYDEMSGQISPDGAWLAYQSNASGRMEVYVRHFPEASVERQISRAGGSQPRWGSSGGELFYVSPENSLMAVSINKGRESSSLQTGVPLVLFQTRLAKGVNVYPAVGTKPQYAVSPDGRFLLNVQAEAAAPPPIIVTTHWTAALKP